MPLLSAEDISVQYRSKILFDGDSFVVEPKDRVGIVGANGTGKSTLLRILAGTVQPDGGKVNAAKGVRLGYLPQEIAAIPEGRLLESVLRAAPGKSGIEDRIAAVEAELATSLDPETQLSLSEELVELHAERHDLEVRYAKHRAEKILVGLGFSNTDFERPLRELSGGWRMRGALAGILFQNPDVLLLDEPTNHLDMPSTHWLNGFLRSFRHALVLICHDREIMNLHAQRIASLEVEGLRNYRGNYDEYVTQRAQELELLENRAKNDEARRKELESFVERFRAKASKARQAQSKMKMIEKMQERIVEIPKPRRSVSLRFPPAARSGDTTVSLSKIDFSYGDRPIFRGLDLMVRRGDRLAIVGLNGAGKTTLLKLIAGELAPEHGEIKIGHNVELRYYAQHHAEVLRLDKTVIEEVWAARPELSQTEARTMCGAFLFSDDEVDKPIAVLSGGEKARVALARLLVRPGNFLLMDEPTNHLDIESAEKLTTSLESYDGTLLFVSHDLDFARRLSNKVWDVHDGIVETFPGSLGEYLDRLGDAAIDDAPLDAKPARVVDGDRAQKKEARQKQREVEAEKRRQKTRLERQVEKAESEIARLEGEQAEVEALLADPSNLTDGENARRLSQRYDNVRRSLESALADWESLGKSLAELD
jgi:ATP-binding cassette, subfamily F, member 3